MKNEIQEIINNLEQIEDTIEGQLLQRKLTRALYKKLGEPKQEDFPEEFNFSRYWDKCDGYTTYVPRHTGEYMKTENNSPTNWQIKRPSATKVQIVEEYTRNGWHARVQSFNVICTKYVKHPRYENLWVFFYRSRDCSRYAYVIEEK